MKSFKLHNLNTISIITIIFLVEEVLNMKLTFPFMKVKMKSKFYDKLNLKLKCNEMYQNIRECAEQCYFKEKSGAGCLGFTKNKTNNNCSICNSASNSDIMVSDNTDINTKHVIYILKYKKKKPVMYLQLEGDNITGTSGIGDGVTGTLIKVENTKIQTGKLYQSLYVKNGGRLELDNTANTCFGNLALCTDGLSIALWINPSMHGSFEHITHSIYSITITLDQSGVIAVWTLGQPNSISAFVTHSVAPVGTWTHVAVVFDPDVRMFIYMNGTLDAFKSINEDFLHTSPYGPHDYIFGSKQHGPYPFDGILDEIKVFYDGLSSAGREPFEKSLQQVLLNVILRM